MMTSERWLRIAGFPDYEVCDQGRVRSFRVSPAGREMSPGRSKSGHRILVIWSDRPETRYVHRLVAEAFIPNPKGHPLVLHWDDNPDNNAADNLRWGTRQDNATDALRNGRITLTQTCPYGHVKSGANLTPHGRCLACRQARYRAGRLGVPFEPSFADTIYKELVK